MKVTAHINTNTPEGRQLVDWLRQFPREVTFEDDVHTVAEPQAVYQTPHAATEETVREGYMPLEEFRKRMYEYVTLEEFRTEAKKRARKLLNENGIYK